MKKILLGLTILSAMAYASEPTPLGTDGQVGEIEIKTTARVVASGLVITVGEAATNVMNLDHGDIIAAVGDGNLERTGTFEIKRGSNNEQLGKEGYQLTVALDHTGKLENKTAGTDEIDHNLAVSLVGAGFEGTGVSTGEQTATATKNLEVGHTVITGTIVSTLGEGYKQVSVGQYENLAILTVTISKP